MEYRRLLGVFGYEILFCDSKEIEIHNNDEDGQESSALNDKAAHLKAVILFLQFDNEILIFFDEKET